MLEINHTHKLINTVGLQKVLRL